MVTRPGEWEAFVVEVLACGCAFNPSQRNGIYLVDVVVRASAEQRMSLATIRTLQVPLPNGRTVPLSQIASVAYGQEYPIVWRRDRQPTVTVQADTALPACSRPLSFGS